MMTCTQLCRLDDLSFHLHLQPKVGEQQGFKTGWWVCQAIGKKNFQSSTKNSSSPIFTLTTAEEKRAQVLVLQRERGEPPWSREGSQLSSNNRFLLRIKTLCTLPTFLMRKKYDKFFRIDFTPIGIDCTLKALQ